MIIGCPVCGTRYGVADDAFAEGDGERRLRCAQCGHAWHYAIATVAAPPVPHEMPDLLLRAEARVGAGGEIQTAPAVEAAPRPSVAAEPPTPGHHRGAMAAVVGAGVLAAVLVLAAILVGDKLRLYQPATAPLAAASPSAEPAGAGLKVSVTPMRSADSLVINGDIVNGAGVARPVPRLRLTLLDGNKIDLASKVIDPPVAQLRPGGSAHFYAVFEHATTAAVRVDVRFAAD
jgi:predicted Zn finger-like uncharacterized protein